MAVMMRPQDQPDAYADSSPFMHAHGLEDPLMIIYTSHTEFEPGVSLMASRLRLGADQWDMPSRIVDFVGTNDHAPLLWNDGGTVHLEDSFSAKTRAELEAMGHRLGPSNGSFGGYQAIYLDAGEGVYFGASEVRKDGQAAGY